MCFTVFAHVTSKPLLGHYRPPTWSIQGTKSGDTQLIFRRRPPPRVKYRLARYLQFSLSTCNEALGRMSPFSVTKINTSEIWKFLLFLLLLHWLDLPCRSLASSRINFQASLTTSYFSPARGRPKKNWMEGIKKVMNERNLNEGQWEDRKQWSLGVGQGRKTFWTRYIHIYIHLTTLFFKSFSTLSNRLFLGSQTDRFLSETLILKHFLHTSFFCNSCHISYPS